MEISRAGLEALKGHEGLRLKAYPDPASGGDPWTIGYGHTHGVVRGDEITAEQAEDFLLEDLAWVYRCISDHVRVPLAQAQFDGLCGLIFNIGAGAFEKSTLLRMLNAGDYAGAGDQFLRWDMAAGQHNAGLARRRREERALFLTETATGAANAPAPRSMQPPEAATPPAPAIPVQTWTPLAGGEAGTPEPEKRMPLPALIGVLATSLIDAFAPLAREKITKEIARHSDSPQVADQVAAAVIETVKQATGKTDPLEAVVAAKANPQIMQQAEDSALNTLDRLAPLLDKIAQWDRQAWDASEASQDAASKRAAGEPYDMARLLVLGAFAVIGALVLFVCVTAGVQVWRDNVKPEVWGTLQGLIGFATGVATTIYAYRFGTTRSSGAKDVVIGELSKRNRSTSS